MPKDDDKRPVRATLFDGLTVIIGVSDSNENPLTADPGMAGAAGVSVWVFANDGRRMCCVDS